MIDRCVVCDEIIPEGIMVCPNCEKTPTQQERVLAYIRKHGSITQIEALNELGVMRLASRISDLRKDGYAIVGKTEAVKNRYGEKCYIKRYSEVAQ